MRLFEDDGMKLDVGCGFRKRGDIGVDLRRTDEVDILADAHFLPFKEETFEEVCTYHLIEHVKNPKAVLTEISQVLKAGGKLTVETPNFSSKNVRADSSHIRSYNWISLKRQLEDAGFRDVRIYCWEITRYLPARVRALMKYLKSNRLRLLVGDNLVGECWKRVT